MLGWEWEDPVEKEMATHSSTLAWNIPWIEEPGGPPSMDRKESDTTEHILMPPIFIIIILLYFQKSIFLVTIEYIK